MNIPFKTCMVGGGLGSFIGESHRFGLQESGYFQLVAACFSQTWEKTWQLGKQLGLDENRCYKDYKTMIDSEMAKEDGARVVVVATPDTVHFEQAKYALEQGMHVICDKPVTLQASEAAVLWKLSQKQNRLLGVTYTWNGSEFVKEARKIVESGSLGKIRSTSSAFISSLGFKLIEADPSNPLHKFSWRFKNAYGKAGNISDVGSHIFQYTSYISGLKSKKLCAKLETAVQGRESDDSDALIVDYGDHAIGSFFMTAAVLLVDEQISVEIFGEKGSLKVEDNNNKGEAFLHVKLEGQDIVTKTFASPKPKQYFSVLYQQYGKAIEAGTCLDYDSYISIKHGFEGMKIIEAACLSAEKETWEEVNYNIDKI